MANSAITGVISNNDLTLGGAASIPMQYVIWWVLATSAITLLVTLFFVFRIFGRSKHQLREQLEKMKKDVSAAKEREETLTRGIAKFYGGAAPSSPKEAVDRFSTSLVEIDAAIAAVRSESVAYDAALNSVPASQFSYELAFRQMRQTLLSDRKVKMDAVSEKNDLLTQVERKNAEISALRADVDRLQRAVSAVTKKSSEDIRSALKITEDKTAAAVRDAQSEHIGNLVDITKTAVASKSGGGNQQQGKRQQQGDQQASAS